MKLIFFDDSKNDAKYKHYHLGAVCIDEGQLAGIVAAVHALALDMHKSLQRYGTSVFFANIFKECPKC